MLPPVERPDEADGDRAAALEAIKETYAGYDRGGRSLLRASHARGFARLVEDLERHVLNDLGRSLPPNRAATVLDLGCGTGDLAAAAAAGVSRWIGVDLRPDAIETARARFPQGSFITASADEVPLDDGTVDVVVARLLFSSLPSPRLEAGVAREVGRLLRPGGWLVWSDIRYSNPSNPAVHGLPSASVERLFPGWEHDLHIVGLLPPIARRLGRLTPVAYPVLAALPPLRSHVVGRLRRPADAGG